MSKECESSFDKFVDGEMKEMLTDMLKRTRMEGVISGGQYVIKTLREAMEISGLDYVPKMWIDSAEEELKKQS